MYSMCNNRCWFCTHWLPNFQTKNIFIDQIKHRSYFHDPLPFNVNSLVPWRSGCDCKNCNLQYWITDCTFKSSFDNVHGWMARDLNDVVWVMAWCLQASSHYMSQSWPSSMLLYGVNYPKWVKYWMYYMHHVTIIRRYYTVPLSLTDGILYLITMSGWQKKKSHRAFAGLLCDRLSVVSDRYLKN